MPGSSGRDRIDWESFFAPHFTINVMFRRLLFGPLMRTFNHPVMNLVRRSLCVDRWITSLCCVGERMLLL